MSSDKNAFVSPVAAPIINSTKRLATGFKNKGLDPARNRAATMRLGRSASNKQPNGEKLARQANQKILEVSYIEALKILNNPYQAKVPKNIDSQVLLTTELCLKGHLNELEQSKEMFKLLNQKQKDHKAIISGEANKYTLMDLDKAISASDREAKNCNSRIKAVEEQHEKCKTMLKRAGMHPISSDSSYASKLHDIAANKRKQQIRENLKRNSAAYTEEFQHWPERLPSGELITDPGLGALPVASGEVLAKALYNLINKTREQDAIRYGNSLDLNPRYTDSRGWDESKVSFMLRYIESNALAQKAIPKLEEILAKQKKDLAALYKRHDALEKNCSPKLVEGHNLAAHIGQLYLVKFSITQLKFSIENTQRMREHAGTVIAITQRIVDELKDYLKKQNKKKQAETDKRPPARGDQNPKQGRDHCKSQKPRRT